jgi:hypothetical protein
MSELLGSAIQLTKNVGPIVPDWNGVVRCAPGWGVNAEGDGYYDPDGAAAGEAADLMMDQHGTLYLQPHSLD